ncbi:MAG: thiol:disulfide interchange protein DsbA/DsbL [Pseudomonadota bacterium]|nr:thiol:disulfide interchange protein DsbA/DsbL [Pseudomonadota bacterium]
MQRRTFLTGLTSLLALNSFSAFAKDGFGLERGVEYKMVPQPQKTAPYPKKVVEIFGYTCPHCYHLEPSLHEWLETKPKDVHFERMPVVFNHPNWIFMGRVFYTAQELGVLDKSHMAFFDALHKDKKELFTPEAIAKFFTQFGVEESKFMATFKSFKVDQLVRKASRMTRAYGVEGVPAIVVNGKYLTDVGMNGSRDKMWSTVNTLSNK